MIKCFSPSLSSLPSSPMIDLTLRTSLLRSFFSYIAMASSNFPSNSKSNAFWYSSRLNSQLLKSFSSRSDISSMRRRVSKSLYKLLKSSFFSYFFEKLEIYVIDFIREVVVEPGFCFSLWKSIILSTITFLCLRATILI